MGKIRNLIQTHQEREIIKTAPDMVIYLDGLPYLINEYLGEKYVVVNFNDYVTSAQGNVDIEALIPTAQFTLSVPNAYRHYFMAPGGNRILESMMEVKMFAKGYFLENGKTVYHRVFWGLVDAVTYVDNGTTLEIDVSCKGICRLLELMQTNEQPAALLVADQHSEISGYISKNPTENPWQQIAKVFIRDVDTTALQLDNVVEAGVTGGTSNAQALQLLRDGYVAKFNVHLRKISKALRLFPLGTLKAKTLAQDIKPSEKQKDPGISTSAENAKELPKKDMVVQQAELELSKIRDWSPDMAIGNITLTDSTITSKLERAKKYIDILGFEGYQDLDGNIIIKPPLYNLDVVNFSTGSNSSEEKQTADTLDTSNNPFVVHLAEIDNERESEDENGIRATRVTVKGHMNSYFQSAGVENLIPGAHHVDFNLIRKFGLREEPAHTIPWLGADEKGIYAFAVAEMVKMNRHYRTWSCTIPLRPELKIGFPIFIPHQDMYAYLRAISWNYNVGGTATMNLSCDMLRRRHMQKIATDVKGANGTTERKYVFKDIPNLVMKFTTPSQPKKDDGAGTNETGQPVVRPNQKEEALSDKQVQLVANSNDRLKNLFGPKVPTTSLSWEVQNDPWFKTPRKCDLAYMQYITKAQPYTDDKGYEVISPFPWGRWLTLKQALEAFTMSDEQKSKSAESDSLVDPKLMEKANAFLFAGLGTPGTNKADQLALTLSSIVKTTDTDNTVFVMDYDETGGESEPGGTDPLKQGPMNSQLDDANTTKELLVLLNTPITSALPKKP